MDTRKETMEPRKKRIYPIPGEDARWDAIQADCRKNDAECLAWQMEEFAEWDKRRSA